MSLAFTNDECQELNAFEPIINHIMFYIFNKAALRLSLFIYLGDYLGFLFWKSEISESVDAYFDRETPFQLDQDLQNKWLVQFHVNFTRSVSLCTTLFYFYSRSWICLNDIYYIKGMKCRMKSILTELEEQCLDDVTCKIQTILNISS